MLPCRNLVDKGRDGPRRSRTVGRLRVHRAIRRAVLARRFVPCRWSDRARATESAPKHVSSRQSRSPIRQEARMLEPARRHRSCPAMARSSRAVGADPRRDRGRGDHEGCLETPARCSLRSCDRSEAQLVFAGTTVPLGGALCRSIERPLSPHQRRSWQPTTGVQRPAGHDPLRSFEVVPNSTRLYVNPSVLSGPATDSAQRRVLRLPASKSVYRLKDSLVDLVVDRVKGISLTIS